MVTCLHSNLPQSWLHLQTFVLQSVDRLVQVLTIRKKIIDMILLHKSITSKPSTAASIKSFFNPLNKHLFKYGKLFINIFEQDPQFLNITSLRELLTQTMWQVVEEGSRNGDYVNGMFNVGRRFNLLFAHLPQLHQPIPAS